jgi:methyltransferase (TIGR00027 family)
MQTGRSSETANISAVMRAAHRLLDPAPWIFDDSWAAPLAGLHSDAELRDALRTFQDQLAAFGTPDEVVQWIRVSRLGVALRGRVAEDELQAALSQRVGQYVILGAGLDSLAYRRPDLMTRLRVFEVDHPATQEHKKARLRALQVEIPPTLEFVPLDFATHTPIFEALARGAFDPTRPAFFSFLGVTWYLRQADLDRTLREITTAASGSAIVVDYLLPAERLEQTDRTVLNMLSSMAAGHGEPGGTCFTPEAIVQRLQQLGFAAAGDFGSVEANARYCAHRSDNLRIPELLHVARALVA